MSTSTPKTTKPRKPSQTARILESVELLVALHEEQGNSLPSTDSPKLVQQLESLERKLSDIAEAAEKRDSSGGDSSELVFETLEKLEQLEKKFTERIDSLKDDLAEAVANRPVPLPPQADPSAFDWSRLDSIESNLAERIEAKISTKIDQQFEQYLELFEGQSNGSPNTQWACEIGKLNDQIEASNVTSEKFLESQSTLAEQIELVSDQLVDLSEKSDRFSESSSTQPVDVDSLAETVCERLAETLSSRLKEEISGHLEQTLADRFVKIDSQLQAIESRETASLNRDELTDEIRLQGEGFVSEFKQHVDEALNKQLAEVRELAIASSKESDSEVDVKDFEDPAVAPSDDVDSASHWHRQKKAMLEKYGIDPDYRPLEKDAKIASAAVEKKIPEVQATAANKLEEFHETINSISPEDSEAIENLKKALNSKLRDAEVELSINRAKLSQQRAELERKQAELEQRASDLEIKLASSHDEQGDKRGGIMSRFTRHLGRGK